jgi:ABC-type transport system involved in cytochrome c biogenesis permease component
VGQNQDPLFRKEIVRWYNSSTACFVIIFFMLLVLLFGIAGISVAHENAEYQGYAWVAVLLAALSGVVIASTSIRLLKRYSDHFQNR